MDEQDEGLLSVSCFVIAGCSFPPFALMQKVEPKEQGKPKRSACFAGPRSLTPPKV